MREDDLLFEAPAKPARSGASSNRQLKATEILGKIYEALIFAPLFIKKKWIELCQVQG